MVILKFGGEHQYVLAELAKNQNKKQRFRPSCPLREICLASVCELYVYFEPALLPCGSTRKHANRKKDRPYNWQGIVSLVSF